MCSNLKIKLMECKIKKKALFQTQMLAFCKQSLQQLDKTWSASDNFHGKYNILFKLLLKIVFLQKWDIDERVICIITLPVIALKEFEKKNKKKNQVWVTLV